MMIALATTRKYGDYGLFTILLSIFSLFHFFHSIHCYTFLNNITQTQPLSQGNTLVSLTQIFELGFFTPNQSSYQYVGVWYKGIYPKTLVWVANRESPLNITDSQAILTIGSHGNLQILTRNNHTVWSTKVNANTDNPAVAILLDSGNLIVKDIKSGSQIWQSFDNPADVFMPGSKIGFNLKTGNKYELSSWKSENDPFPGNFKVEISSKKPPEVYVMVNGTNTVWRSGPWDKAKYTGIPDMDTFYESQYDVEEDSEKGTTFMRFKSYQSSSLRYFILSTKGVIMLMVKNEEGRFYTNWEIPESLCDFYGACGPFGVCRTFTSPNCECLRGFVPKSNQDWKTRIWRDGCVRRKELICRKNKTSIDSKVGLRDGFRRIGNVKPPDFYEFVELSFPSEDNCRKTCQGNCSCLAYSYVQGIGCLVWSKVLIDIQGFTFGGVDLFVRLNHEELVGLGRKTIMTSVVVLFACGIIGAAALVFRKRRAIRTGSENDARDITETTKLFELAEPSESTRHNLQLLKQHSATELLMFEFSAILTATDNFSQANKLGQGGFGSVYKGTMPDGKLVAAKRLSSISGQGVREFKNEMILISRLQHRNLVKLFGYCIEKEEKLLVYEYMSNNSLDNFLFNSSRRGELNWTTRMSIILGVSRGLAYLHHDSCLRIIHRDLKVSNILLDEKMNPKISDFGLARMFEGTMDLTKTRRIVGTLGYMSPEYAIAGLFSEKSDVFSFGVILLEILSGHKNTSFYDYENYLTLIAYAWKMWSEDKGPKMVDEALEGLYSPAEAMRCLNVALLCVQDSATDRPTMTDVVFMLSNETDRPEPKQPIFSFQISTGSDFQRANDVNSSSNEATTSLIEGR